MREALAWSAVWIGLALAFNLAVYRASVREAARVPDRLPDREGALGRQPVRVRRDLLVLRGAGGAASTGCCSGASSARWCCAARSSRSARRCSTRFHWMIYVFGAFLVFTGIKLLFQQRRVGCTRSATRCCGSFARLVPSVSEYHGQHFIDRPGRPALRDAAAAGAGGGRGHATSCSRSTRSRRSSRSRAIRSSSTRRTSSPSSACARCTSLLAGVIGRFDYLKVGLRACSRSSAPRCCSSDVYELPSGLARASSSLLIGGSALASVMLPKRDAASLDRRSRA